VLAPVVLYRKENAVLGCPTRYVKSHVDFSFPFFCPGSETFNVTSRKYAEMELTIEGEEMALKFKCLRDKTSNTVPRGDIILYQNFHGVMQNVGRKITLHNDCDLDGSLARFNDLVMDILGVDSKKPGNYTTFSAATSYCLGRGHTSGERENCIGCRAYMARPSEVCGYRKFTRRPVECYQSGVSLRLEQKPNTTLRNAVRLIQRGSKFK